MIEMSLETAIWVAILFFLFVKVGLPILFPPEKPDNPKNNINGNGGYIEKNINNNTKIYKNIDKENLALENLHIQKEELENEIDKLELESSTDFEKEATNSTRIKKLNLKIKHIDISIENKYSNIDTFNKELKGNY